MGAAGVPWWVSWKQRSQRMVNLGLSFGLGRPFFRSMYRTSSSGLHTKPPPPPPPNLSLNTTTCIPFPPPSPAIRRQIHNNHVNLAPPTECLHRHKTTHEHHRPPITPDHTPPTRLATHRSDSKKRRRSSATSTPIHHQLPPPPATTTTEHPLAWRTGERECALHFGDRHFHIKQRDTAARRLPSSTSGRRVVGVGVIRRVLGTQGELHGHVGDGVESDLRLGGFHLLFAPDARRPARTRVNFYRCKHTHTHTHTHTDTHATPKIGAPTRCQ